MSATLQNLMKSTKSLAEVASKTVGSKASHQYAKLMEANAKYVISVARKLGATVFLTFEDIVEVKPKMLMTFVAAIMVAAGH